MTKRYASEKQAFRVRTEACRLAADVICAEGGDTGSGRLWSLCVFFESYIGQGASGTRKDFGPVVSKPRKAPVIQLITHD